MSSGPLFPLKSRRFASTSQKRRSPATPARPSSTSSGLTTCRDFTGATEMRATRPSMPPTYLLRRLAHLHDFSAAPDAAAVELEDPEVAARHVHGDVVDRDVADAALERARVGVSVQDEVGAVLGDRGREPLGAEVRLDAGRLAFERVDDRRVVEEHDAQVAVADRLEAR